MAEIGCGATPQAPGVSPCGGFSKSQRRKMRVRRTAVLKSREQTQSLKMLLHGGVDAGATHVFSATHIETRMANMEGKLDSVLSLLAAS